MAPEARRLKPDAHIKSLPIRSLRLKITKSLGKRNGYRVEVRPVKTQELVGITNDQKPSPKQFPIFQRKNFQNKPLNTVKP